MDSVDSDVKQVKKWSVSAFLMKQSNRGGTSRAGQLQRSETGVRACGRTRPGARPWERRPVTREGRGCGRSGSQALGETRVSEGPACSCLDPFGEHVFVEHILQVLGVSREQNQTQVPVLFA